MRYLVSVSRKKKAIKEAEEQMKFELRRKQILEKEEEERRKVAEEKMRRYIIVEMEEETIRETAKNMQVNIYRDLAFSLMARRNWPDVRAVLP